MRSVASLLRLRSQAVIVPRRVANMLMQRLRNVVNSRRVLSAPTVPVMMTCRFSVHRAQT